MPDTIDFASKRVLVLGASGFIGSRFVSELERNPIYKPIAASRHSGLSLDATNPDAIRSALQDVDCLVNCVAGDEKIIVESTRAICNAARAVPPRRIVHLSSMAVYGAATGTVAEDHPPVEPLSGYGRAKLEAERIVQKYVQDGGDAVILRPTCVFGPDSPQWTIRLERLLKARRVGDLGIAGDGCCNLAFIDDVVAALIAAMEVPGIAGRAFNVSSSSELTWNEFLIAFGKALGATPIHRVPGRTLRIEAKVLAPFRRIASKAVHGPMTEAITPSLLALWQQDIRVDCTAARSVLSLPRTSPDDMIAAVISRRPATKEAALS